jgi:hypothetical protein
MITGCLAGALSVIGLPLLLYYQAYILFLASLANDAAYARVHPFGLGQIATRGILLLLLLPYVFAGIGAVYGYVRHYDVRNELHWHWRLAIRPHHALALCTGYAAYVFVCFVSGTWVLITKAPLLAVLSGPFLILIWQFLHNKLLYSIGKPNWSSLVASTIQIWFPRRLGIDNQDICSVRATEGGRLELSGRFSPHLAEEARMISVAIPGVSSVEIRDQNGVPIQDTNPAHKLTALMEAGRMVAQIRRQREFMFATNGYEERHESVDDYSGRLLVTTVSVVTFLIIMSLLLVSLKGGFRTVTAEDLQWFFGKYSPSGAQADIHAMPQNAPTNR